MNIIILVHKEYIGNKSATHSIENVVVGKITKFVSGYERDFIKIGYVKRH